MVMVRIDDDLGVQVRSGGASTDEVHTVTPAYARPRPSLRWIEIGRKPRGIISRLESGSVVNGACWIASA